MDRGIGPGRAAMSAVGRGIKGMIESERSGGARLKRSPGVCDGLSMGDGEAGGVRMVVTVMGPVVSAATSRQLQEWKR